MVRTLKDSFESALPTDRKRGNLPLFYCIDNCVVACDMRRVFVSLRAQFGRGDSPLFCIFYSVRFLSSDLRGG